MKRDRDSQDQALKVGLFVWSGVGAGLGVLLGLLLASNRGWPALPTMLGCGAAGAAFVWFAVGRMASAAAEVGASLYVPSGKSVPARAEYSLAGSLEARGRYQEAAAAYERAAAEDPAAVEPCLRLGRLLRDRLADPESAVSWFRRARDRTREADLAHLATRELVELLGNRLDARERALPDLARLAELHADSPGGAWARAEIRRLKAGPDSERDDGEHD